MDIPSPIIELNEVTFGYSPRAAVFHRLSFTMRKGDKIGLVGANGTGKTTLFHLIMGLHKPFSGDVQIFGKRRNAEIDFREVRERIGLLFQDADDQLFCPSVAEDIAFGPLNLRKTHEETQRIVQETLAIVGLRGYGNRVPYRLSAGEKKLVALATVLAMKPEVLLLDEPTSGLDEGKTDMIVDFLKKNNQLSYFIISHDRHLLKRTTEALYRMKDGKIERWEED